MEVIEDEILNTSNKENGVLDEMKLISDEELDKIKSIYDEALGSIQEKRNTVDVELKKKLFSILKLKNFRLCEEIQNLILMAFDLAEENKYCSLTLPYQMISDVLEFTSLEDATICLDFVSDKLDKLKKEPHYSSGKYILLRSFNDLIKRIPRVSGSNLCGKIQWILSSFFPLSEKSALNLTSEFNVDKTSLLISEDIETNIYESPGENQIDFYNKLWGIRQCLNDPNVIFLSSDSWKKFTQDVNSILQLLKSLDNSQYKPNFFNNFITDTGNNIYTGNVTNPKLLNAQLHDIDFRHQILLQIYIIIHYLKSKTKLQCHELVENQMEWCNETCISIIKILEKYDVLFKCNFSEFVQKLILNEEAWSHWKDQGCPPFTMNKVPIIEPNQQNPLLIDYNEWNFEDCTYFENPRINYLWNINPVNSDACKCENIISPSKRITDFIEHCLKQNPDAFNFNSPSKYTSQSWFQWRILRLFSQDISFTFPSFTSHTSVIAYIEHLLTPYIN